MNTTGQSLHIESLISDSVKREKKADVIQKLYLLCIEEFSEQDFDTLIQLIEESVLSWIRKQLWIAGCYSEDEENTILQDARLAVWNAVQSAVKGSEIVGKFAFYALGIYKNKARDRIRSISRQRKKYTFVTIRRQDDEEEENWEDIYPPYHEDYGEKEERRKVYEGLFRLYCSTLMSSKAFPPRCLALYYARILPHLLSEIPDSKAASAKWAFERMDHFTVWRLTQDSEKTLKADIDDRLAWNENYMIQLNDEVIIAEYTGRLKDVVYTSAYNKEKIEDWSEYMHKTIMKAACRRLSEDKALSAQVKEYVTTDRVLLNFQNNKGE